MGRSRIALNLVLGALAVAFICAAGELHAWFLAHRPENTITVRAVAHEWWWEFDYLPSGIKSKNELHVPTSSDVDFELVSADVLHSFWMQGMDRPVDVVPGRTRHLHLQMNSAGELYGNCDSGCGCGQVCMRFRVTVESTSAFAHWLRRIRWERGAFAPQKGTPPACALGKAMPITSDLAAAHLRNVLRN